MKNKKILWSSIVILIILLLAVIVLLLFLNGNLKKDKSAEKDAVLENITYFSEYTDCEVFQKVPLMGEAQAFNIEEVIESGDDVFIMNVYGPNVEDYESYLETLGMAGFKKHSDNGTEGLANTVRTATYIKDDLVVTVSHVSSMFRTYIACSNKLSLSEHLIYKESYVENVSADAKTTVSMLEMDDFGNSFVIQLKNGNFIVHDGGIAGDSEHLISYMEERVPEGQKPIIEAWFISHPHVDHHGAILNIATTSHLAARLYVEGVYFVEPSVEVISKVGYDANAVWMVASAYSGFETSSGEKTQLYRPQLGQRYYFCDITIDVCLTADQFTINEYIGADPNDVSIWLLHNIDGQNMLIAGDTGHTGQTIALNMYPESFFDYDILASFHHSINFYDYFMNVVKFDTLLHTNDIPTHRFAPEENERMNGMAKESLSHGDGTVVLTFPYEIGTAKILDKYF